MIWSSASGVMISSLLFLSNIDHLEQVEDYGCFLLCL
jgi:hypothetical protein